jgi:3',5'-cyclic AMP phosphodiesterase CpdA
MGGQPAGTPTAAVPPAGDAVSSPFLLVQLSDPHIGAAWGGPDPVAAWQAAIDTVRRSPDRPDAVLVTGDLTEKAASAEYAVVKAGLDALGLPAYVLPGNHDDQAVFAPSSPCPGRPTNRCITRLIWAL